VVLQLGGWARCQQLLTVKKYPVTKNSYSKPLTWTDPSINGRIILRRIFRKWDVGLWTGSIWLRIGTGGGHL